jgi:YaiO family outer membrane protein
MMKHSVVLTTIVLSAYAAGAWGAQGSALRGLKPPKSPLEAAAADSASGTMPDAWSRFDAWTLDALPPSRTSFWGLRPGKQSAFQSSNTYGLVYQAQSEKRPGSMLDEGFHGARYLPPSSVTLAELRQSLAGGWGIGLGMREYRQDNTASRLISITGEQMWGNVRGAYTLYAGRSDAAAPSTFASRFRVDYRYDDRNTVGLAYKIGRETDYLGYPFQYGPGESRDLSLFGRHWLSTNWAFTYDIVNSDQNSILRRQGLRLGLRHIF